MTPATGIYRIQGTIHLSRYTTSAPKPKDAPRDQEHTMPLICDRDGNMVPHLPAQQIKAGVRRGLLAAILQALGQEQSMRLVDFRYNAIGGVKEKRGDDEEKIPPMRTEEIDAIRAANPIISLCGGSEVKGHFMAGRLYVTNGIPEAGTYRLEQMRHARHDDTQTHPDFASLALSAEGYDEAILAAEKMDDKKDLQKESKRLTASLKKAKDDKTCDRSADIASLSAQLEAAKEGVKGAATSTLMPYNTEYVVFTAPLQVMLTLHRGSLVELGALLTGLIHQAQNDPFYGARRMVGFGEYAAVYTLGENTLTLNPFREGVVTGDLFTRALAAFQEALPQFCLAAPVRAVSKRKKAAAGDPQEETEVAADKEEVSTRDDSDLSLFTEQD